MDASVKQKIVERVLEQRGIADVYRKAYVEKWADFAHAYYCRRQDDTTREYRANVYLPLTYDKIEAVANHIYRYTFGMRPFFGIRTRGKKVGNEPREILENIVQYQFDNAQLEPFAQNLCRWTPTYGTNIVKVTWGNRPGAKILAPDTETLSAGLQYADVSQEVRMQDGVVLSWISPFDFYVDPSATSLMDASFAGQRIINLKTQFAEKYHKGLYPLLSGSDFELIMKGSAQEEPDKALLDETRESVGEIPGDVSADKVELFEWYSFYDEADKGNPKEYITLIANRQYLLRLEENTYGQKPFVFIKYIGDPHNIYGMSLAEVIYSIQEIVNTLQNQRLDNLSIAINKIWKIFPHGVYDISQVKSAPGQQILVRQDNAVSEMPIEDVTGSSAMEIRWLEQYSDKVTGVTDFFRGVGGKSDTTKYEVEQMLDRSAGKYVLPIRYFHYGIAELVSRVVSLTLKYMPAEVVERVYGEEAANLYRLIPGDNVETMFDFTILGTAQLGHNETQLARMLQLLEVARNVPEFAQALNFRAFLQRIFLSSGIERPEELLAPQVAPAPMMPVEGMPPGGMPAGMPGAGAPMMPTATMPDTGTLPKGGEAGIPWRTIT